MLGPSYSLIFEHGYAEGKRISAFLTEQLSALGVSTFGDLRLADGSGWKLVVMAADVTRGQLVRLPWDYERYGLDPDEQSVVDAVRASISVPYLFEPARLGDSLLVDGGLISNYAIDIFDDSPTETIGVTLIPQLPAQDTKLLPALGPLHLIPGFQFLESVLVTAVFGRDQAYLAQPSVAARTIEVDSLGVNPLDFNVSAETVARLYESGRAGAESFVAATAS